MILSRHQLHTFALIAIAALTSDTASAQEVFSGPQVGEPLPAFKVQGVLGKHAGKQINPVQSVDGKAKPKARLLMFVQKERQTHTLLRPILLYAMTQRKAGLHTTVVHLTDDAPATRDLLSRHDERYGPAITYSNEGLEGPGAYGLNRKIPCTIIVAKDGKVIANFALRQPSIKADGQRVLDQIASAIGTKQKPDIYRFTVTDPRMKPNPNMRKKPWEHTVTMSGLTKPLRDPDAGEDEFAKAIEAIRNYSSKSSTATLKTQVSLTTLLKLKSKQLNPKAVTLVEALHKELTNAIRSTGDSRQVLALLGAITKAGTETELQSAVKRVRDYVEKHPAQKPQCGRMAAQLIGSKFAALSTPDAIKQLRALAKQYQPEAAKKPAAK